jgi:signal transduction histidine kinase
MARTWSVCLRGIAAQMDAIGAAWRALADRAFLPLAVFAHLCVSLFGGATLLGRMAVADDPGRILFDPSVLLFLLAGATSALLLLHVNGAAFPEEPAASTEREEIAPPMPKTLAMREPSAPDAFDGLLHHVGHELRTPLNAIIGFAELMQRELLGPLGSPRYQEYARHIRESGVTLLKAAEDVMALTTLLADRDVRRTEGADADRLVSEACAAADTGARGIHIMRGAPCYATIDAEAAAMRQALSTLISSAAKGAPEYRPIGVTTRVLGDTSRSAATRPRGESRLTRSRPWPWPGCCWSCRGQRLRTPAATMAQGGWRPRCRWHGSSATRPMRSLPAQGRVLKAT